MIVVITYVDSITGVSLSKENSLNGPKLPDLQGLRIMWAKTSKYPTNAPEFVCEILDGQNINIEGVLGTLTQEQEQQELAIELEARTNQEYEQHAKPIRDRRNQLLSSSDIYVLPDFPITVEKLQEWKAYRQTLRDITLQASFPHSVDWPTKPE